MGIIAVVMWDTLFPSRRDVFALGPLPVESRVHSAGRLGGLLTLFGTVRRGAERACRHFSFRSCRQATSSASSAAWSDTRHDRSRPTHSCSSASRRVQGVLIVATSRRAAERLAPIIQTGAVLLLLLGLLFFGPLRGATTGALAEATIANPCSDGVRSPGSSVSTKPSAARPRPVMHALALRGLLAGIGALRRDDRALRVRVPAALRPGHRDERTVDLVGACDAGGGGGPACIHPASCRTGDLRVHAPRADAKPASSDAAVDLRGRRAGADRRRAAARDLRYADGIFRQPTVGTLAAPLIVSAALAVGFRTLLAIPVDLPARWIFQTLSVPPLRAMSGVHKAGVIVVLLPVVSPPGYRRCCSGDRPLPGDTRCSAARSVCSCSIAPAVVSRRAVRPGLRPRRLALPHVVAALSVRLHRLHLLGGRRRARAPS